MDAARGVRRWNGVTEEQAMERDFDFFEPSWPAGALADRAAQLATEAQWWARERNVEAVWCWLPTFDQVCEGTHTVTALGNDGMAVNAVVDSERAERVSGIGGEQAQLAYLGRMLMHFRRLEMADR